MQKTKRIKRQNVYEICSTIFYVTADFSLVCHADLVLLMIDDIRVVSITMVQYMQGYTSNPKSENMKE